LYDFHTAKLRFRVRYRRAYFFSAGGSFLFVL
jgi:hypothetical protein